MGDERDRDRKRAAVMISMLVPAYQMQDAAAIAAAASEALGDPEAVSVGVAATMLRGMEAHGLVDRQPYLGRDDGSEWWSLTDAGLVAAQVMRGLMEGEEGEDGTAEDEGGAQLGCALAFWGEGANPQVEALQALAALVERRCAGCFDAPPSGECEDCLDAADAEIKALIHGINVWMQSGRASRPRVEVGLRAHRLAVLCAVLATANGDLEAAIGEEMGGDGTAHGWPLPPAPSPCTSHTARGGYMETGLRALAQGAGLETVLEALVQELHGNTDCPRDCDLGEEMGCPWPEGYGADLPPAECASNRAHAVCWARLSIAKTMGGVSDDTAGSLRLPPGEGAGATTETTTAGGGDVDQDRRCGNCQFEMIGKCSLQHHRDCDPDEPACEQWSPWPPGGDGA